jgi:hypothetical protein
MQYLKLPTPEELIRKIKEDVEKEVEKQTEMTDVERDEYRKKLLREKGMPVTSLGIGD